MSKHFSQDFALSNLGKFFAANVTKQMSSEIQSVTIFKVLIQKYPQNIIALISNHNYLYFDKVDTI